MTLADAIVAALIMLGFYGVEENIKIMVKNQHRLADRLDRIGAKLDGISSERIE